jgi:peptidoglycan hydrolase-like protein with peptidoglycan-binding domain
VSDDAHGPVAHSERAAGEQATPTKTSAPIGGPDGLGAHAGRGRTRLRALGALAAVVVAAVVAVIVANPFAGSGGSGGGVSDNATPISYATVNRESLSQQTQVSATLGYAGSASILLPSGNAPSVLQQSSQSVTSAEAQVASARGTLVGDTTALQALRASISATRAKAAVDCAGDNAGESASSSPSASGEKDGDAGSGSTCSSDQQALATDESSLPQDQAKVEGDQNSLASAQMSLANARSSYATGRATAAAYAQGAAYTALPSVGQIIHRNEGLFSIAGQPTVLLYGATPATRAFIAGMSAGADVGELNSNLQALGYGHGLGGDAFTPATAAAIRAFQSAHGIAPTGELLLGSVVFWYGPARVTSVNPTLGAAVDPGPALSVTATTRQVTIQLDASQQGSVKVGDRVTITLPDNETTPGVVEAVGTVAKTPSSAGKGGEESSPTIEVAVRPTDPAATGHLDQAPVQVSITTQSVEGVLTVPVTALLALSGGGYAVEEAGANNVHRLVAVSTGLFDGANGRVQVSGSELAAGQRVVVPASS